MYLLWVFVFLVITPKRFLEEPVVILPACHHLQPGQSPGNPSINAFPSLVAALIWSVLGYKLLVAT